MFKSAIIGIQVNSNRVSIFLEKTLDPENFAHNLRLINKRIKLGR